jgi:hypothetical protein
MCRRSTPISSSSPTDPPETARSREHPHHARGRGRVPQRPVMLYSIGKDSAVMLHLAMKAFYPGKPPFPLLHVDTTWKFREMIEFRDRHARARAGADRPHQPGRACQCISPFVHGSKKHTDIMKTEGLKQALDKYRFDAAFRRGAPRRGEVARQGAGLLLPRQEPPLGPEEPAARAVEPLQRPHRQGREHPRLPALQLDRAGHLAVHLSGEHPDRAALLRQGAPGGRARRHADHGR